MTDEDEPTQPGRRRRMARGSIVPRKWSPADEVVFLACLTAILGLAVLFIIHLGECT